MTTGYSLIAPPGPPVYSAWYGVTIGEGLWIERQWTGVDSPNPANRTNNFYNGTRRGEMTQLLLARRTSDGFQSWFLASDYADKTVSATASDWPTMMELLNKARSEISGHSFNAAVAIAEGHQTLQMLFDTASRVNRAFSAVRKGNIVNALRELGYRRKPVRAVIDPNAKLVRRVTKGVPVYQNPRNGHVYEITKEKLALDPGALLLELKYGWLPFYSDIFELMRLFYAISNKPEQREVRVRIVRKGNYYNPTAKNSWAVNRVVNHQTLTLRLTEDFTLWQQLGLDDPAGLLWEKLGYSFVFDWVLPISSYLSARSFLYGIKGKMTNTAFQRIQLRSRPEGCIRPGWTVVQPGWHTLHKVYLYRNPWTDIASLKNEGLKFPGFRTWADSQTLTRAGVAFALIQQQADKFRMRPGRKTPTAAPSPVVKATPGNFPESHINF